MQHVESRGLDSCRGVEKSDLWKKSPCLERLSCFILQYGWFSSNTTKPYRQTLNKRSAPPRRLRSLPTSEESRTLVRGRAHFGWGEQMVWKRSRGSCVSQSRETFFNRGGVWRDYLSPFIPIPSFTTVHIWPRVTANTPKTFTLGLRWLERLLLQ